ncbi:MAG: hypothetical protein LUD29_05950 [Clostridia bacterium]|nr:hypothetical protein [Clostridia bacterium]
MIGKADIVMTDELQKLVDRALRSFMTRFPETIIDTRKNLVGVGVPGKHLFCYFYMDDVGNLMLRYKTGKVFRCDGEIDFEANASETMELFDSRDFTVKEKTKKIHPDEYAEANAGDASGKRPKEDTAARSDTGPGKGEDLDRILDVPFMFNDLEARYSGLLDDLMQNIRDIASDNLNEAGCHILFGRLGISSARLDFGAIGVDLGLDHKEAQELMLYVIDAYRDAEDEKGPILDRLAAMSLDEFTIYLLMTDEDIRLTPFFYDAYLCKPYKRSDFRRVQTILGERERARGGPILYGDKYNRLSHKILDHIYFGEKKRHITDEEFSRLQPKRKVSTYGNPDFEVTDNHGDVIYCESELQKSVFRNLMDYNIFLEVKAQCLRVPYYGETSAYPTFQCLTKDHYLVLLEIKPAFNMAEFNNVRRYESMKKYCEKYGFGLLIMDEDYDSYYDIDDCLPGIDEDVLALLKRKEEMSYYEFKNIVAKNKKIARSTVHMTNYLVSIVKRLDLKLTPDPFRLSFAHKKEDGGK